MDIRTRRMVYMEATMRKTDGHGHHKQARCMAVGLLAGSRSCVLVVKIWQMTSEVRMPMGPQFACLLTVSPSARRRTICDTSACKGLVGTPNRAQWRVLITSRVLRGWNPACSVAGFLEVDA